tara:strand:+ start:2454 stop:3605 length:1152 start_codon:yes stop_codon:yes gene_type:complete
MKVLHINGTAYGGAANFVIDLHKSLLEKNVESILYIPKKRNIPKLIHPNSIFFKFHNMIKVILIKTINRFIIKSNQTITLAYFNSYEIRKIIKNEKPDLINIHWIGNEFLSINEILNFKKPIVWTLHDMWTFLPVEHYKDNNKSIGYFESFFLNRKKKLNKKKINFVPTSTWMNNAIKYSNLYDKNKIIKIPCGINFNEWYPEDKKTARSLLGLNESVKIILFSSINGKSPRKGFELLSESLSYINKKFQLVISGDQIPKNLSYKNTVFFDKPSDIITRRLLYSAADVLAAPSVLEAFGLVALEAAACGTPSVIFENNGISEIIEHKKNGYVAKHLDIKDYAKGINWILEEFNPVNVRENVKDKFDINKISDKYFELYKSLQK